MTTIRLPIDVVLDLPPATMATFVNPRRLRELLCELSAAELARLFEPDSDEAAPVAPLVPPVLAKRRGRKPRQHGAGVDSPADMGPVVGGEAG